LGRSLGRTLGALAAAALLAATTAQAQTAQAQTAQAQTAQVQTPYPSHAIRIIVPFAPGGATLLDAVHTRATRPGAWKNRGWPMV